MILLMFGCARGDGPMPIRAPEMPPISLDYGEFDLPSRTPTMAGAAAPRVQASNIPADPSFDRLPVPVEIQVPFAFAPGLLHSSRTCLLSQAAFYHRREKGLRAAFCAPELGEKRAELNALLQAAARRMTAESTPDTRPEFRAGPIHLAIAPVSYLKKFGRLLVSVDGAPYGRRLAKAGLRGESGHFTTAPRDREDSSRAHLGRVFPMAWFHLLIHERKTVLLYELNSRDYLIVSAESETVDPSRIADGLEAIQKNLLREAQSLSPRLTEIYFGNQGLKRDAYVELGSPGEKNTRARIRVRGAKVKDLDVFLFPGGTIVLPGGEIDLRDELLLENIPEGISERFRLADYRDIGALRERALVPRDNENFAPPQPARFSRGGSVAGNKGLHPRFARREFTDAPASSCTREDFLLTEWNPFGIYTDDGRLRTGGKFVELRVERACRNESIFVFAGDSVLDPGSGILPGRALLLFAADTTLFTYPNIRKSSGLRALREHARIEIYDAANNARSVLREPPPARTYIPGSGDRDSRFMGRVHSLVGGHDAPEKFHGRESRGLRPDLTRSHAMSPGYPSPGETVEQELRTTSSPFRLSEILPRGSLDAHGNSLAADEFLELALEPSTIQAAEMDASRNANLLQLNVRTIGGGNRRYVFPAPESSAGTGPAYLVFARTTPLCFPKSDEFVIRVPGLSLPNGGGHYSLLDARGLSLDEITIDNGVHALLDGDSRRSYTRTPNGYWRPTHGSAARTCPLTLGTPGSGPSFAPFILEQHVPAPDATNRDPEFKYMASGAERLEIRVGAHANGSFVTTRVDLSPGDTFRVPAPPGYYLIQVHSASRPEQPALFVGQYYGSPPSLIIDSVSPTPGPDRFEWVRLCSPGGFHGDSLQGEPTLTDGNSRDILIPWNARRPAVSPPSGLKGDSMELRAGECALVVDPDYSGGPLHVDSRDRALWTIQSSSALGNGLASGEALRLFIRDSAGGEVNLASLGRPDSLAPFSLNTSSGEFIRRLPGTLRDAPENFEIAIIE